MTFNHRERRKYLRRMQRKLRRVQMKVRWIQNTILFFHGKSDGKEGIPQTDETNRWMSPFISKELHSAETFIAHQWAEHEIFVFNQQEELNQLSVKIDELEVQKQEKLALAPKALTEDESRRKFEKEEGGNTEVLRKRRLEEWTKSNASYFTRMRNLVIEINTLKNRRADLLGIIDEAACVTRLICEKKRNLHRQRIDSYYRGVLVTHVDNKKMPPFIDTRWMNYAEMLYLAQHDEKHRRGNHVAV